MDTPQYLNADVSSIDTVARKLFYTNHRDLDAPQYVNVDVSSDYFFTESFITQISAIWTLPSMYTLMYLQMFQLFESFITHTAIWTLPSM